MQEWLMQEWLIIILHAGVARRLIYAGVAHIYIYLACLHAGMGVARICRSGSCTLHAGVARSLHAGMGVARSLHAGMAHAGVARSLHAGVAHAGVARSLYICRSGSCGSGSMQTIYAPFLHADYIYTPACRL